MFMVFKQIKTLIDIKDIKQTKQNKTKQNRETDTQGQIKQVKHRLEHVNKTKGKHAEKN